MNTLYFVAISFIALLLLNLLHDRKREPLPPGPSPLPIIGNLHQAPSHYPERVYHQWSKTHGPIFKLQYGQQTIIMLSNFETAKDLLDKRTNIYSGRPRLAMADDLVGKNHHPIFMQYNDRYRRILRLQTSFMNPRASRSYTVIQDVESKQVVYDLLSSNDFRYQFHRYASSLLFTIAYGKRLPRGDEPELAAIAQVISNLVVAARVGAWIVDAIPQLNHLPKILAPWKGIAEKLFQFESGVHRENYELGMSTSTWNWCKHTSQMPEAKVMPYTELIYAIGTVYEAGSDTSTMALQSFIMAAVLNPQVVRKAQAELDSVVGPDRLPTFDDKARLPYITAIMQETLRWRPVIQGGMPHAVSEDDSYKGYHIPKGSIVIPNSWALSHVESIFPHPEDFIPERWIENSSLPVSAWGFGKRICMGRFLAMNSLYINMARILWAFDIEHAYEERGGEMVRCEVDPMAMTEGLSSGPMPFKAVFKVRSKLAEDVIKKEWEGVEKDVVILEDIWKMQSAVGLKV